MNARNGKIARLPHEIREELNLRLERSEPGPKLLAWLNGLKPVQKVLREDFNGAPISKQNLSEWRQGGFQEWLARQELQAGVDNMEAFTLDQDPERDDLMIDDVATVLAAHYAGLLANWNGVVTPEFTAKAQILTRLSRGVVPLQRSMHRAKKDYDALCDKLDKEGEEVKEKIKKRKLDQIFGLIRHGKLARIFADFPCADKIASYVLALQNDDPNAKLDITDEELQEAKEAHEKEAQAEKQKQSAAPSKRAPKKPATKKEDNSLAENQIQDDDESPEPPIPSSQVKPDQTTFLPSLGASITETNREQFQAPATE